MIYLLIAVLGWAIVGLIFGILASKILLIKPNRLVEQLLVVLLADSNSVFVFLWGPSVIIA